LAHPLRETQNHVLSRARKTACLFCVFRFCVGAKHIGNSDKVSRGRAAAFAPAAIGTTRVQTHLLFHCDSNIDAIQTLLPTCCCCCCCCCCCTSPECRAAINVERPVGIRPPVSRHWRGAAWLPAHFQNFALQRAFQWPSSPSTSHAHAYPRGSPSTRCLPSDSGTASRGRPSTQRRSCPRSTILRTQSRQIIAMAQMMRRVALLALVAAACVAACVSAVPHSGESSALALVRMVHAQDHSTSRQGTRWVGGGQRELMLISHL
jgi:hypothetical protein